MKLTKAEEKMVDFGLEHAFLELRGIMRDPSKLRDVGKDMINDGNGKTYFVKVAAGGRVTIPAPIRRELGIDGDFVCIERVGDTIIIGNLKTLNEWYRAYFVKGAMKRGASWEAAGGKDTYELAKERAKELARREPAPLSPERAARLAEIIDHA